MKQPVVYSCGHPGLIEMSGDFSKDKSRRSWYETKAVCPACYASRMEEERTGESEAVCNLLRLPKLFGSDKQIAWALSIRKRRLTEFAPLFEGVAKIDEALEICKSDEEREAKLAAARDVAEQLVRVFLNDSAKYWIDTREVTELDALASK